MKNENDKKLLLCIPKEMKSSIKAMAKEYGLTSSGFLRMIISQRIILFNNYKKSPPVNVSQIDPF